MKRVVLVSFGHVDVSLSLVRNFTDYAKNIEISLILVFSQNKKRESIIDFEHLDVPNGFQDENFTRQILGSSLNTYCKGIDIQIFVYHNLKARSFKNFTLSLSLIKKLRNYDIIHVSGQDGTLLHSLPFIKKTQIIHTVHDLVAHSGEGNDRISFMTKYVLRKSERVIFQNKDDLTHVRTIKKLGPKSTFIPIGPLSVYRTFSNRCCNKPDIDILFFGRISKYKGLEHLLEALNKLDQLHFFSKVVIAGNGDYDFGLDQYDFGIKLNFINQHLSNSDLVDLIERSRIVVCPYTDATQSGVLMTAIAFNRPVIATAVNGFKDVIINGVNGILVEPNNSVALEDAIKLVLTNINLQKRITENLRNDALGEFSWPKIVKSLQIIYNTSR